jgi:hypothetical protein
VRAFGFFAAYGAPSHFGILDSISAIAHPQKIIAGITNKK